MMTRLPAQLFFCAGSHAAALDARLALLTRALIISCQQRPNIRNIVGLAELSLIRDCPPIRSEPIPSS